MDAVRKFIAAGKPVVGIRTASHAFDAKGELTDGRAVWPTFDADVLGGHYSGHYGLGPKTTVTTDRGAASHAILNGVRLPIDTSGSLYKVSPLAKTTTTLLIGSIPGQATEPVAWINQTGQSRVFYTSLGAPEDFRRPAFRAYFRMAFCGRWISQFPHRDTQEIELTVLSVPRFGQRSSYRRGTFVVSSSPQPAESVLP